MHKITESALEDTTLAWLKDLGYEVLFGPDISPEGDTLTLPLSQREREGYSDVVLTGRLRKSLRAINPNIPDEAIEDVVRKITRTESPSLIENNRRFHRMLTDGIPIEYRRKPSPQPSPTGRGRSEAEGEGIVGDAGEIVHDIVWLIDIEDLANNDWLAVNQFTVVEGHKNRRPDILIFVNGLPLAVIELKNPADEKATIKHAFNQLQTYKEDISSLFVFNELLVVSDGLEARMGTLTANWERFMPWRTISGMDFHQPLIPSPGASRHPLPKGEGNNMPPSPNSSPSGRGTGEGAEPGRRIRDEGAKHEEEGFARKSELEVLLKGVFEKKRLLDLILNFVVFEDDGTQIVKKVAAYHQYHAVNKAVNSTISACGIEAEPNLLFGRFPAPEEKNPFSIKEKQTPFSDTRHFGKRKIGVIWHTQGSGKSLLMAFYAGKIIRHPAMENPTLVVITDRNDLDDQLFGTFSGCKDLLRQTPVQAESREHIKELLKVAAGGVIFTTIQKFLPDIKDSSYPVLSKRENIVVIADEAHRSQYDFIDGFARHMRDALPNASFIGFTATPLERDDRSTPAVFGNYIDTYDILRAVEDGATVPIYYEGRLAKIELSEEEKPKLDPEFEEVTEGEEESEKQKLRTKWARLEAMVGTEKRIRLVADDLVSHFERRLEAMDGKALIVCMSRRICIDMYNALIKLRPEWHHRDDDKGAIKIVMTGSASDPLEWQQHIRNKARREVLAKRFKDPSNPLKLVIVRDMWLTGFDVPCLHTMYVDKPMRSHGLMQAIARVNRVFKDKPGGLVVDYLGLADQLKRALADYTASGGRGKATIDQEEAVAFMLEKYEIVRDMYHGFDYKPILLVQPAGRMAGIAAAMEHILSLEDGKKRYLQAVTVLSKAFALAVPHEETLRIRDEVGFFQEVRSTLAKAAVEGEGKTPEELDTAIRQLISKAIVSNEVVDIFAASGLKKPDISILSDEFLAEVQQLPQRNLAVELLQKLLKDEIKARMRKNVVLARSFAEMLEEAIRKYQNRTIEAAQVISELIKLAKEMRQAQRRGEDLGLTEDEVAFYDALEVNDSAVRVLGDETLRIIARELVAAVRRSVTIDWTMRENARAQIRVIVKRILRKYGYPPDKQEKATQTVLEQAEVLCRDWTDGN